MLLVAYTITSIRTACLLISYPQYFLVCANSGSYMQLLNAQDRSSILQHLNFAVADEQQDDQQSYCEEEFLLSHRFSLPLSTEDESTAGGIAGKVGVSEVAEYFDRVIPPSCKRYVYHTFLLNDQILENAILINLAPTIFRSSYASGLSENLLNDRRITLDYLPMLKTMAAFDLSARTEQKSVSMTGRITRQRRLMSYFDSLQYGGHRKGLDCAVEGLAKGLIGR